MGAKRLVHSRFNVDVWSHYLEHCQDRVIIDFLRYGWPINYQSCVSVINSQHSPNVFMQRCLRELWLLLALYNITLIVRSVRGCDNWLADSLSRFHTGKYCQHFKSLAGARSLTECTVPDSLFTFALKWQDLLSEFIGAFCFSENAAQLLHYANSIQSFAFQESTKRNMRTQLNSYLLFCDYCAFEPFPVSKQAFLAYLAFLSKSLSCYRSLVNYVNILKHINKSLGADFSFMHNYDAFLTQRALRRIMGDCVRVTHPVTVDILLNIFQHFDFSNQLHICMHALFLVAFFSFLRISNLVPYASADCHADNAYFLKRQDVYFTASGAVLRVYRTKTIQFKQHVLDIPLPFIPNSILCPVTALKKYFCTVPALDSSPLFIVHHGRLLKPILAAHFNRFFKSCIATVGLEPGSFSCRSFRQGGATFAFNCGTPTEFIKAQGDWRSDAYLVYLKLSTKKKLDILQAISARLSGLAI